LPGPLRRRMGGSRSAGLPNTCRFRGRIQPVRVRAVFAIALHLAGAASALGQVQTFRNDYAGFVAAAGRLSTIAFDTLPDGSPSFPGTQITSTFNYDLQGAHFSSPFSNPEITGNPTDGYQLATYM